jgi:hypothetical protein
MTQRAVELAPLGNGEFVIEGVDAGNGRLRASVTDDASLLGPWVGFTVEPGRRVSGLVLAVEGAPLSVRGRVRDRRGSPLAQATVHVVSESAQATTDHGGWFVLRGLDPGEYQLFTDVAGYEHGEVTVVVGSSPAPASEVEIVLDPE